MAATWRVCLLWAMAASPCVCTRPTAVQQQASGTHPAGALHATLTARDHRISNTSHHEQGTALLEEQSALDSVQGPSSVPADSPISPIVNALKTTIKAYAALNGGKCPESSSPIIVPLVDQEYTYGVGCNFLKDSNLCMCPNSPFYTCASESPFGQPVGTGLTPTWVSFFGYCRISLWVYVAPVVLIAFCILGCVVVKKVGSKTDEAEPQ